MHHKKHRKTKRTKTVTRDPVSRDDRPGATKQTQAHLKPDPFQTMVKKGLLNTDQILAASEIHRIYFAVAAPVRVRAHQIRESGGGGGKGEMSDEEDAIFSQRYKPWCLDNQDITAAAFDLIIDAITPPNSVVTYRIVDALSDYARRMRVGLEEG